MGQGTTFNATPRFPSGAETTKLAAWTGGEAREPDAPSINNLPQLARVPFDQTPRALRREVFDVPYVQLDDATGGRLRVTQHGWRHSKQLDLVAKGFRVLDTKPNHTVLRHRPGKGLLCRGPRFA